ncbi:MAG: methylenetetrahydrofolate reductase [Acidobacteriota bacterium]
MTTRISNFTRALNSGRLVVTAECLPPRGSDGEAVRNFSDSLPKNLDAVVVADNPDAIRSSALSAASLMRKSGRESVILAMNTRDRNRLALMSDALGAAALGVSAILCVTGNHQSIDICPQAGSANDLDSVQFIQALKNMILHGTGLGGNKLDPKPNLQVGAIAHPFMLPLGLNMLRMKKKVLAGADFLITQAVFDFDVFEKWMDAMRQAGFDKRVAIIPSVLALEDATEAKELQERGIYGPISDETVKRIQEAANPEDEGIAIASETAAKLKGLPGVRGIHILNSGRASLVADVIKRAGIGFENLCTVT